MAYTTINDPTDYFNTKLYTGNGSTQSITGVGFAPDMVWTKKRSATDFHAINDKVRGALKIVFPNTTDAEDTSSGCLTSFDSDGFSLGSNGGFNANTATFASWNWLASTQLHQTQMEVSHQQFQQTLQVDLVLCLIQEQVLMRLWVMG